MQQGDVLIYDTPDGGDILIEAGIAYMDGGLRGVIYLSLFGGNEEDSGMLGDPHTWWANLNETDPAYKYVSETQYLLQSLPATTGNINRLKDAVNGDLEWLITKGIAGSISVDVNLPGLNKVQITVGINESESYDFIENWKAAA